MMTFVIIFAVLFSLLSCMGLFGLDSSEQNSTTNNQQVALNAGGVGISSSNFAGASIVNADAEVADKGLDLAKGVSNAAFETLYYLSDASSRFYDRAQQSVDSSVATAERIAGTAAPVSPGNYAEAVAGQNSKTIIIVAVLIVGIFMITRKK